LLLVDAAAVTVTMLIRR